MPDDTSRDGGTATPSVGVGASTAPILAELQGALNEVAGLLARHGDGERLATANWPRIVLGGQDQISETRTTIAAYRRDAATASPEVGARLLLMVDRLRLTGLDAGVALRAQPTLQAALRLGPHRRLVEAGLDLREAAVALGQRDGGHLRTGLLNV